MTGWFESLGLWGSLGVFTVAALLILVVGSRLEEWADDIGNVTKLGQVFAGTILLAVSTSLPEIATSATAALRGNVDVAINNLLGGVIIQTMVLAVADAAGKRRALTSSYPSFGLLMQGVALIFILATAAIAAALETRWAGVGWIEDAAPVSVALIYIIMQFIIIRTRGNPRWMPAADPSADADADTPLGPTTSLEDSAEQAPTGGRSLRSLLVLYVAGSLLVCFGGYAVVLSTERIAAATGASQSFLGFTLIAFATSLPEIGTTISATRRGHGVAAASNVFGSNGFDVALIALVALLVDGPVFENALISTVLAAGIGIILTAVYLLGMLERKDRTLLRMGWDSAGVLVIGLLGMLAMYALGSK